LALSKVDPEASYAYETITLESENRVIFAFEQGRSADIVAQMLRIMLKRKPLIHNGRKPR
ncbi:MAG TPA: hypothetical protein VF885_24510, partial [Arthrobacter sp.]